MNETLRDPNKPPAALWAHTPTGDLHPVRVLQNEPGIRGRLVRSLRDGWEWWADRVYNDWEIPTQT